MTEEEKQKVVDLWEQGMTGTAIGELLGVTRCAILGIINRMRNNGYVFNRPFEQNRARRENVNKVKKIRAPIVPKAPKALKAPKAPKLPKVINEPKPIDIKEPLTNMSVDIMGLTRLSCRYPISEDNMTPIMFCGKQQEYGSYCQYHGNLCYYPSKYQRPILSE